MLDVAVQGGELGQCGLASENVVIQARGEPFFSGGMEMVPRNESMTMPVYVTRDGGCRLSSLSPSPEVAWPVCCDPRVREVAAEIEKSSSEYSKLKMKKKLGPVKDAGRPGGWD